MSLRALSSDGQSTSLTRKGSAVQVRQRPRSSLTSAPSCALRPLFARDTDALKERSGDATGRRSGDTAETQQADAAAKGSSHKQRAESVPRRTGGEMETESKLIGDRIQENRELRKQGFSEPETVGAAGISEIISRPAIPCGLPLQLLYTNYAHLATSDPRARPRL